MQDRKEHDVDCGSISPFREDADDEQVQDDSSSENSATGAHVFQFVRQLGVDLASGEFDLPPFPDTALRVQECVRDPDSDITQLGAIVATEPALAARLMRMANSAMMRRGPVEVTDINTAISRVGMDMVQSAAISFASREAFKFPPGSACIDDLTSLRKQSVQVASISYALGKSTSCGGKPDEAMLAGLLSSVGKYYIFMKTSDHPELFTDREALDALVRQWHTGIARAIVESWNFPESIAQAVDEQEIEQRDREAEANLSDVLFIANIIAGQGAEAAPGTDDLDALARLQLTGERLGALLAEREDEIQSMIEALGG